MSNPFESGERKLVPAVLVYVRHRGRILMIHRNGRPGDYHSGKWNGLGGKLEADESPLEAARRELREESGLDLAEGAFVPLGTLQFPLFKAHKGEDWLVYLFAADWAGGDPVLVPCEEGELHWVPEGELASLNLWAGDRHFIPLVVARKPFVGTVWYRGDEVLRHWIQAL